MAFFTITQLTFQHTQRGFLSNKTVLVEAYLGIHRQIVYIWRHWIIWIHKVRSWEQQTANARRSRRFFLILQESRRFRRSRFSQQLTLSWRINLRLFGQRWKDCGFWVRRGRVRNGGIQILLRGIRILFVKGSDGGAVVICPQKGGMLSVSRREGQPWDHSTIRLFLRKIALGHLLRSQI